MREDEIVVFRVGLVAGKAGLVLRFISHTCWSGPSPPGPDVSKGPLVIGVTAFLHIISLSLYGTRIYTRVRPTVRLGLDDYFLTVAVVSKLRACVVKKPMLIKSSRSAT